MIAYIVALMIEAAEVHPGDTVLEVGAGSGYAAAVMSRIADRVYAIERVPSLGEAARRRFKRLGYDDIELRVGDGTTGWPETAPFDAILVAAGGPDVPPALREQLAIGGRLVIPVGEVLHDQSLLKITRTSETRFEAEDLGAVRFVPLGCVLRPLRAWRQCGVLGGLRVQLIHGLAAPRTNRPRCQRRRHHTPVSSGAGRATLGGKLIPPRLTAR